MDNSILAVEVPTLECIDTKSFESIEHASNPMYRFRPTYQETEYNLGKCMTKNRKLL